MAHRVDSFQTNPYLRARFQAVGQDLAFAAKTRDEWRAWVRTARRTLKRLTGYDTMQPASLAPRVVESVDFPEYRRQKVEIRTEPGIRMPFYVLIPRRGQAPFPGVLAPHGHCGGGKVAVAGCREDPEVARAIDEYHYDYGVQFVREGFIVFCPDARGFGERREAGAQSSLLSSSCQAINSMAQPLGQTVAGMWAWDLHRLLDYAASRPDCDGRRIGCAGLSGGGLQTLWATALDDRIRCAVISGYLYGARESLLDMTCCSCNYVPHLFERMDLGDIAALIAPRPLLVETGTADPLNGASGLANVQSQMRIIRRAYRLLGAADRIRHDVFEGGHRWHGVEALPWMKRHLS